MKLLIIITKYGAVEFNDYWCRANDMEYELIPNDQKPLFLIKPNAFADEITSDKYYNGEDFWDQLIKKLKESFTENRFNTSGIKEIGIIAHASESPNIIDQFKELGNNIVFKKVYHSSTNVLWKGAESPATKGEGSLPLDKLRDAVCNCQDSNFDKAFEEVWNFFFGDPDLEAKLELLHACLTPTRLDTAEKEYNKVVSLTTEQEVKNKIKTAFDNMKKEMSKENTDCFNEQYLKKLEGLRNTLL